METICKLKDIYKALYEFESAFHSEYSITINEGIIMCQLSDGPRKAGDICMESSLSTTRLSKVLKCLESKDYIKRTFDKEDRRVVIVSLTRQGKEKVDGMKSASICIPDSLKALIDK